MTHDTIRQMARDVRALRMDLPGVRWLSTTHDGDALRRLIRACYGETYSYKRLYLEGHLEALWSADALLSLGEFSADGVLIGHTAFWSKDPKLSYLESGLSLVAPDRREGLRVDYRRVWRPLLERLSAHVAYVHQNTTTLHPMAQFYALKHMKARPAGWVFDYALGERLLGLSEVGGAMQALVMTTPLDGVKPAEAVLPRGRWRAWLSALASGLGVPVRDDPGEPQDGEAVRAETVERNDALGLLRTCLTGGADGLDGALERAEARVCLAHVPAIDGCGALFEALLARGYVPTGVRPHHGRPHEWVLQRLPDVAATARALEHAQLATDLLNTLAQEWRRCALTS